MRTIISLFQDSKSTYWIAPYLIVLVIAIVIVSVDLIEVLTHPSLTVSDDPALFYIGGQELLKGNPPYSTYWDIKPPGIYYVTAGLAAVAGKNVTGIIIGGALVAAASVVASSALSVLFASELELDPIAVFAAGLIPLGYEVWAFGVSKGLYPYHLAALTGFGALILVIRGDSPIFVGILSALSLGFWQFSVGWILMIMSIIWMAEDNYSRKYIKHIITGFSGTAVLIWAPIFFFNAGQEAIIQTFIIPAVWTLKGPSDGGILKTGYYYLPMASILILTVATIVGYLTDYLKRHIKIENIHIGLGVGIIFYSIIAQAAGQSAGLDGIPFVLLISIVAAMGVNRIVSIVRRGALTPAEIAIITVIVTSLVLSPFVWWQIPLLEPGSGTAGETTAHFLSGEPISSCHFRNSDVERWWLQNTGTQGECIGQISRALKHI